ncbi:helix-turn-helix transcriptional regulator [Bacillus subtilis]|uniref:helix-turn-helix transcriptional regulator n=1 Tax=Bacillus subtilis TaxID=1423 RepID=UPI002DB9BA0B|nr:helix-turn-helix transcriptional regulator [Bacillus subtilis]MEC3621579.1 helix-turn-helix transcriptional regulator [Bacillus subtilis]MEC3633426.1 helix-turn-helix transcriptional regulator [Bacillus subtilis]MEC3643828.1 helix-turn-helix transcriptional regulator [Bacillus subtilis]MEC3648823.1 helix-turn-helix transcriptional regulator [Bacillus subtilis]MEC3699021.1 helix-turn-helix transcriptional regulator [Bacillus subtilis]
MDKKLIGQRLLSLRAEKSRSEVARAVKISVSALQMYETGQRIPRDEIKIKLADYYQKTVQQIFFDKKHHEMKGEKITA